MKRRSILLAVGIVFLLVVGGAATLALLVLHEPEFYRRAMRPAGEQRKQWSKEFVEKSAQHVLQAILNEHPWHEEFTEEQINSYFAEDFVRTVSVEKTYPEGIADPRLAIDDNRVRLAFRYGTRPWSTIISIDLNVWLVPKEPNVVALEIEGLYAGALPISAQSILERLSEAIRRQWQDQIEVTWYRHNGKPVAILRFQGEKREYSLQLRQLKLQPKTLVLAGAPVGRMSAAKLPE